MRRGAFLEPSLHCPQTLAEDLCNLSLVLNADLGEGHFDRLRWHRSWHDQPPLALRFFFGFLPCLTSQSACLSISSRHLSGRAFSKPMATVPSRSSLSRLT